MIRLYFCIAFLFFSCKNNNTPKGIISPNQMKQMMKEMVQAEVFVSNYVLKDTTKKHKEETMKLYQTIFTIHKTDSQTFLKSFDYYMSNPNIAKEMLDSLRVQQKIINLKPINPI